MGRKKKPKPAYYRVWSASDGTILLALPGPKSPKNPRGPGSDYDEDGCSCHYEWDESVLGYREWALAVARGAIVNNINLKKTLRARVENRLDRIEATLAEVAAGLRRLEEGDGQGANRGLKSRREGSVGDGA